MNEINTYLPDIDDTTDQSDMLFAPPPSSITGIQPPSAVQPMSLSSSAGHQPSMHGHNSFSATLPAQSFIQQRPAGFSQQIISAFPQANTHNTILVHHAPKGMSPGLTSFKSLNIASPQLFSVAQPSQQMQNLGDDILSVKILARNADNSRMDVLVYDGATPRQASLIFNSAPDTHMYHSRPERDSQGRLRIPKEELERLVRDGYTNKQIANQFSVSTNTIKRRIAEFFSKDQIETFRKEGRHIRKLRSTPLPAQKTPGYGPVSGIEAPSSTVLNLGPSRSNEDLTAKTETTTESREISFGTRDRSLDIQASQSLDFSNPINNPFF
ncbi:hypothetical protein PCE1_003260 [Barthelona sp. PCE]